MQQRDYRDMAAGGMLVAIGAAASAYAVASYPLGTVARMGPGMFPAVLGVLLVLFGLAIGVPALGRQGRVPAVEVAPLVSILAGAIAFALLVERLGYVPAVFAATLISTFAARRLDPLRAVLYCAGLAALAWLIFGLGLRLPIPAFAWRF